MIDQLELILPNQRSEIPGVQDQVESFSRRRGLAERVLHDVQLALEEHLTNILAHGYVDPSEHQIHCRVQLSETELRIQVEDDARPFNPLSHPVPDVSQPIEKRQVGGLGIHMMRESLDGMEYRREDGKNVLVMIKRI